ncbi:MAG: hypothetical protein FWB72_05785 [Firmicutes bacterium]|nr:hypothetical protein [Bacillota bacterium]
MNILNKFHKAYPTRLEKIWAAISFDLIIISLLLCIFPFTQDFIFSRTLSCIGRYNARWFLPFGIVISLTFVFNLKLFSHNLKLSGLNFSPLITTIVVTSLLLLIIPLKLATVLIIDYDVLDEHMFLAITFTAYTSLSLLTLLLYAIIARRHYLYAIFIPLLAGLGVINLIANAQNGHLIAFWQILVLISALVSLLIINFISKLFVKIEPIEPFNL